MTRHKHEGGIIQHRSITRFYSHTVDITALSAAHPSSYVQEEVPTVGAGMENNDFGAVLFIKGDFAMSQAPCQMSHAITFGIHLSTI